MILAYLIRGRLFASKTNSSYACLRQPTSQNYVENIKIRVADNFTVFTFFNYSEQHANLKATLKEESLSLNNTVMS